MTDSSKEKDLHIPLVEKLKSIPEVFGIRVNEEPTYETLKKDGDFEIRRYGKQLRAEVTIKNQSFDEFHQTAFKKLAGYIFGGNTHKQDIAMTSPVLQKNESSSEELAMTSPVLQKRTSQNEWTMSFILPEKYNLSNAPVPNDQDVKLIEKPAFDAASIRYSGNNTLEMMQKNEIELSRWVKRQSQLQVVGDFFAAQFDQPFAIPFLKRNEILIEVMVKQ